MTEHPAAEHPSPVTPQTEAGRYSGVVGLDTEESGALWKHLVNVGAGSDTWELLKAAIESERALATRTIRGRWAAIKHTRVSRFIDGDEVLGMVIKQMDEALDSLARPVEEEK